MKLYLVRFDEMPTYVEARSFAEAIELWSRHMADEQGADWDGDEQPEEVALVHNEAVVRREPDEAEGLGECEGCHAPATRADIEGVPLCDACYDAAPKADDEGVGR